MRCCVQRGPGTGEQSLRETAEGALAEWASVHYSHRNAYYSAQRTVWRSHRALFAESGF